MRASHAGVRAFSFHTSSVSAVDTFGRLPNAGGHRSVTQGQDLQLEGRTAPELEGNSQLISQIEFCENHN